MITHCDHQAFRWYLAKRIAWLVFAIPFYQAGLAFTVWLLEPQHGYSVQELWAMAFPGMLLLFVLLQRHLGGASGYCRGRHTRSPGHHSRRILGQSSSGETAA